MTDVQAVSVRLERAQAQCEALRRVLGNVLAIVAKEGGYRSAVDQATVREARALLAEGERK